MTTGAQPKAKGRRLAKSTRRVTELYQGLQRRASGYEPDKERAPRMRAACGGSAVGRAKSRAVSLACLDAPAPLQERD